MLLFPSIKCFQVYQNSFIVVIRRSIIEVITDYLWLHTVNQILNGFKNKQLESQTLVVGGLHLNKWPSPCIKDYWVDCQRNVELCKVRRLIGKTSQTCNVTWQCWKPFYSQLLQTNVYLVRSMFLPMWSIRGVNFSIHAFLATMVSGLSCFKSMITRRVLEQTVKSLANSDGTKHFAYFFEAIIISELKKDGRRFSGTFASKMTTLLEVSESLILSVLFTWSCFWKFLKHFLPSQHWSCWKMTRAL